METLKSLVAFLVLPLCPGRQQAVEGVGRSSLSRCGFTGESSSFSSNSGVDSSSSPSGLRAPRPRANAGVGLVVGGLEPSVEVDAVTDDRGCRCRVNPVGTRALSSMTSRLLSLDGVEGSVSRHSSSSSSSFCACLLCAPPGGSGESCVSPQEKWRRGSSAEGAASASSEASGRSVEASRNYFRSSGVKLVPKGAKPSGKVRENRGRREPAPVYAESADAPGQDVHRKSLGRSCSTASTSSASSSWVPLGSAERQFHSNNRTKAGSFRDARPQWKGVNESPLFYAATLEAAALDCSLQGLNPEQERVRARVRLPDLGADSLDYPLPPAILYQSHAAETLDPALVGLQRPVLPKRDVGFEQQSKERRDQALKIPLTPRSVMALPLSERKKFLYNMLCCFCVELSDGVSFRQLTATREYVLAHCRLSPDLKILQVDIRNGRVLEFPVDQIQAVYTLSRRQTPVLSGSACTRGMEQPAKNEEQTSDGRNTEISSAAKPRRNRDNGWMEGEDSSEEDVPSHHADDWDNSSSGRSECRSYSDEDVCSAGWKASFRRSLDSASLTSSQSVASSALPSKATFLPPLDLTLLTRRDSQQRGSLCAPVVVPSTPTYAKVPASRRDRWMGHEEREEPPQFIVVLDFASRKLAFVFGDRAQAGTFELGFALLAKASHQHPLSTLASIAAAADNFPYTPRAARAILHALAGTKDPASGLADPGEVTNFTRPGRTADGSGVHTGDGDCEREASSADDAVAWLTDSQAAAAVEAAAAALTAVEDVSVRNWGKTHAVKENEGSATHVESTGVDSKNYRGAQTAGRSVNVDGAVDVSGGETNGAGEREEKFMSGQKAPGEGGERNDFETSSKVNVDGSAAHSPTGRKPLRVICSDGREEIMSLRTRGNSEVAGDGIVQVRHCKKG
ncbi:hypothetical protein TGARI_312580 [Toxoplasma gondii ARI]|uniref:Transmembrane protein n=1 Tax=Toxoplasma gondii ARI TaxID=1074872 RepID=A0A139Y8P0_TOXGO|nr:hypothetical protein TGARI_312580 [Toxoplasma gondii ARI]